MATKGNNNKNSFGKNLKRIRYSKGFTQNDVSKRAGGLSQSAVAQLEGDKIDPTLATIMKLSAALMVPPFKLIELTEGETIDVPEFVEAKTIDDLSPTSIKSAMKLIGQLKRLNLLDND